jgi:hypothetical protein
MEHLEQNEDHIEEFYNRDPLYLPTGSYKGSYNIFGYKGFQLQLPQGLYLSDIRQAVARGRHVGNADDASFAHVIFQGAKVTASITMR